MNALRIRKHLKGPIAELPELTPMVGKDVEIIVIEENPSGSPEPSPVAGVGKPFESLEQVRSKLPGDPFGPDFERTIREWRNEPWSSHELAEEK